MKTQIIKIASLPPKVEEQLISVGLKAPFTVKTAQAFTDFVDMDQSGSNILSDTINRIDRDVNQAISEGRGIVNGATGNDLLNRISVAESNARAISDPSLLSKIKEVKQLLLGSMGITL